MRYLRTIGALWACVTALAAPDVSTLELKLQRELLAPCCYHETLDRHNSDIAVTMRAEIHSMLTAGKSEREILDLYQSRFGKQVLAEPEGTTWWVGTLIPLAALAASFWFVIRWLRRRARAWNKLSPDTMPLDLPDDDEIFHEA